MADWCILRTNGRHTLRLADTLAEAGFDVWTPIETKRIKVPRMTAKRDVRLPLLPSFVFAQKPQMADLIALSQQHRKEYRVFDIEKHRWVTRLHPDFSLFHYFDRIPIVSDEALNPLRRIARRRTAKPSARPLEYGQAVKAGELAGSYQGMVGKVERSNEKMTLVCFGSGLFSNVEIPTSYLIADGVCGNQSAVGSGPRKAA